MSKSTQILCLLLRGEGGRIGRMRGFLQTAQFHHIFSSDQSLTHHLRGPPSPKTGEGFESLISFENLIFLTRRSQLVSLPSPSGRRWPNRPDEGLLQTAHFPRFSVQINPSPTTCVVPPLPKRARVFSKLISLIKMCLPK